MPVYQLKNYKLDKEMFEDFRSIRIDEDDEVFYSVPTCIVEYGKEYKDPYLLPRKDDIPLAIEKAELVAQVSTLKKFHLKVNEETGKLEETTKEKADISRRLPPDTNIDELVFMNGELLKEEKVETKESKGES